MTDFVYDHYTQQTLDRAYDQREWAANAVAIMDSWRQAASQRLSLGCREIAYGQSDRQKIDLYPLPDVSSTPVHFHVHGGAWRTLDKESGAFIIPAQQQAGLLTAIPDFDLLPQVTLEELFAQLVEALVKTVRLAPEYGGDVSRLIVSGHSSGAHLAALLAATNLTQYGLAADCIKSLLLISGPYDLEPVLLSARRDYIHLDSDQAAALNAYQHADKINCPVSLLYGELESPEFIRQSVAMSDRLTALGKTVNCAKVANVNHFEIMHQMGDTDSQVFMALQCAIPD